MDYWITLFEVVIQMRWRGSLEGIGGGGEGVKSGRIARNTSPPPQRKRDTKLEGGWRLAFERHEKPAWGYTTRRILGPLTWAG
jgi:hypothetical protein